MIILSLFLKIKFKYVVSFISIISFYIFLFEKRYFKINSDWKIFYHNFDSSLTHFTVRVVNVSDDIQINLAIFSKLNKKLQILDIFNSSMSKIDVLSDPKIILEKNLFDDFIYYDLKIFKNKSILFIGISKNNQIIRYDDWKLSYKKKIFNYEIFFCHSLEILEKENLILITGEDITDQKLPSSIVMSFNLTNGEVLWRTLLNNTPNNSESNVDNRNDEDTVFSHWKLKLIEQHQKLDHLKEKSAHINLKETSPIYYEDKVTLKFVKMYKSINPTNPKKRSDTTTLDSYNSLLTIHKDGLTLLDLHSGSIIVTENIKLDSHSTFTKWPSVDHLYEEDLFQVKLVSKLDHYMKNNIDIHHIHDTKSEDTDVYQHKIHCNLLFHKLNNRQMSLHDSKSWFVSHLCDPVNYMDYPRFGERSWLEDPSKSIAPVITDDLATPSGLWGRIYHLIGRKLIDVNSKNVICMSSDGLMTSYSSHGHSNWRINAQVGWLHISRMVNSNGGFPIDDHTKEVYLNHFKPSLSIVSLNYLKQNIKAILAIGFESLSFVDLRDGYLLASHSLPCTPIDRPIVVATQGKDYFSLYGDQIIIVKCENMILGFSLIHYVPWMYFAIMCGLMVAGLLLIMWTLDPNNTYITELWI